MQISRVVKDWAAHVAPELDADAWAGVRAGEASESFYRVNAKHPVRDDFPEMFAALLAYRDKVAGGLSEGESLSDATFLLGVVGCRASGSTVRWRRFREMGLADRHGRATDFGREVARVLGGGR